MKTLRYSNLEKIMTIYTEISTYITFHNATGLTDINKSMEDFCTVPGLSETKLSERMSR